MTDFLAGTEAGAQRRARVLGRLREVGVLSVADLARELGVSHMTVRRDLQRLETTGQVRTVHGGVGLAVGDPRFGMSGMARDRAGSRRLVARAGPGHHPARRCRISRSTSSCVMDWWRYASRQWNIRPTPHPAIGKIGQKNPWSEVSAMKSQTATKSPFTTK